MATPPGQAEPEAGWQGRHAVELYVRTYSTMLQSSGWIRLDSLASMHIRMGSSLHGLADSHQVDMGAFLYSIRRLPREIADVRRVILGQSPHRFQAALGLDVETWRRLKAPARRRPWYFDGDETLAVFLASPSDVDDLVPTLVAYEIEWNKLHVALREAGGGLDGARHAAEASEADWERLREAWGPDFEAMLAQVRARTCQLWIRLIGGSQVGFARNAGRWWQPIQAELDRLALTDSPVYFVSSNVHSLVNVVSGVARELESLIVDFARSTDPDLVEELRKLDQGRSPASRENWLYYAARALFDGHPEAARLRAERSAVEQSIGIHHLAPPEGGVDSATQIVQLSGLDASRLDPRIGAVNQEALAASSAYILNVDYPLGLGAYHLLRQVAESVHWVDGVYLMGKAATLNAQVGDVMLPNVVYNEHSGNTYWLDNCFDAASVQPYLEFGSALDHQRAVTVRGTFLQNRDYLDFYYQGRYTVVEMEVGPYLDACYEIVQPARYPLNENVSMTQLTLDLGIIHYASDTPYTQARTLGARGLSYRGMDATYASSIAVMRRVLEQEGVLAEQVPAVPV